jgi:gliding motility-associated-like protein
MTIIYSAAAQLPCDHPDRVPLDLMMPNVFTPNNDGVNDLYRPVYNQNDFTSYALNVYNRSGRLIFFADRPAMGWNGRNPAGVQVPDGVYFFILEFKTSCEQERQTGSFELRR